MKKIIADRSDAAGFVNDLTSENKYHLGARVLPSGEYEIQWTEKKDYVDFNGQTMPDEFWITEAGEVFNIQDLSGEHARNILRLVLRNEREMKAAVTAALQQVATQMDTEIDEDLDSQMVAPNVLH